MRVLFRIRPLRFSAPAQLLLFLFLPVGFSLLFPPVDLSPTFDAYSIFFRKPRFFAAWLTMYESSRGRSMQKYLRSVSFPRERNFVFDYIIVNLTRSNSSAEHLLYPPDEFRDLILANPNPRYRPLSDLASKFIFALRFFLLHTHHRWFWRGTDDAIINFAKLPNFVEFLDRTYNPLTETVILGNCIGKDRESFLQGGSGWVLSRRAAERVEALRWAWVPRIDHADDVRFTRVLDRLNVSLANATSPFFLGHDLYFNGETIAGDCPGLATIKNPPCAPFLVPLQDVVFFHEQLGSSLDVSMTRANAERTFQTERAVHYWMSRDRPALCRKKPANRDSFAVS
jgi:hypothetical protein